MCEFIKDTDCRIIRRNFTLGFCMRSIKFTKLYARMVEDETCHIIPYTNTLLAEISGVRPPATSSREVGVSYHP